MQTDWSNWLPIAQYTHNTWPSDTTKKTPFELIMGFTPRAHQALRTHEIPSLSERSAHIDKLRWEAQTVIKKAQKLMSNHQGQHFKPYQINNRVWLEATNLTIMHPTSKLLPKRYGPFKVTNIISNMVYKLKLPPQWKIHNVFHASLLLPYHETTIHGPNYHKPPPDIIDGEKEWEVKEIVGSRRFGCWKKLQYQVRWKGYSAAYNSWEPAEGIHTPTLIQELRSKKIKGGP